MLTEVASIKARTRFQGGSSSIFSGTDITFTTGSGTTSPTQTTINIADLSTQKLLSFNSSGATAITTATVGVVTTLAASTSRVVGSDSGSFVVTATSGTIAAGAAVFNAANVDTGWRVSDTGEAASATSVRLVAGKTTTLALTATDVVTFRVGSSSSSAAVMTAVQNNITNRAQLGSYQQQLNYIVDNMQTLSNNLADAMSRIVDTNYASETAKLTRGQILQQAATSMLAQANQMPNVILTLLK